MAPLLASGVLPDQAPLAAAPRPITSRPWAKARRSAAAKKAAETRKANRDAERAAELAEYEREVRIPAATCPHIDPRAVETQCIEEPGHDGDHEDINGHTWPNED
ncbi:hypothetical protein [Streptomyces sp. NPDC087437]|uniref:hypothetical protein n=1 Tax=Streptomyces sp. NPDC087437 TaxID=3365789 RepID=UPI00381F79C1